MRITVLQSIKNAKKMVLRKNTQLALLAVALCLLAVTGYALTRAARVEVITEETPLYNYSLAAGATYEVRLKENELYPEGVMGEGGIYAQILIDSIDVNCTADYSGDQAAAISGDYTIEVLVEGYQVISEVRRTVYQRSFPLVAAKPIKGENNANISQKVSLDLKTYIAFAEKAEQILGSKPGRSAQLLFHGVFLAQNAYGQVEEPFTYIMDLPLNNELFSITKGESVSKTGAINETRELVVQPDTSKIVVLAIAIFLEFAAFLTLLFFTRRPTAEELYALNFKIIERKHGSRIVKLNALPPFPKGTEIEINDLASLVKIADERQQSIYCFLGEDGLPEKGLLYVPDGNRHYFLRLQK